MNGTNQNRTNEYLKIFNREVVLKSLIDKANPVIFDVGANVGSRSKLFLSIGAKVVAFEPQPELCEHLKQHLRFHKNQKN